MSLRPSGAATYKFIVTRQAAARAGILREIMG